MSVKLTEEQFQALLTKLPPERHGSFTTFTKEYDGTKTSEKVEAFLTAASVFKQLENISDVEALSEIPLLLKIDAAIWWHGVKEQVITWKNFKDELRHAFVPKKPAYVLFQEIIEEQDSCTSIENVIAHKRILFAQLPPPIFPEIQQLDMIYSGLKSLIRVKVPRDSFTSYEELLRAARKVEHVCLNQTQILEFNQMRTKEKTSMKKWCSFCRFKGHLVEECRKLKTKQENLKHKDESKHVLCPKLEFCKTTTSSSASELKVQCNKCGAPDIDFNSCPTCAGRLATQSADLSSSSENITLDNRNRPIVFVAIAGIKTSGYIDTCAKPNILAYQLYNQMAHMGHEFYKAVDVITLADGIAKQQRILKTTLPVKLESRVVPTTFTVLPECKNTLTLLGIGFIIDAKMILNLGQFTWKFVDDNTIFELYEEEG